MASQPALSTDGTAPAPSPPPFFRIPLELRDEIYHLAFSCDNEIVQVRSLVELLDRIRQDRRYQNDLRRQRFPPAIPAPSVPVTNTLTPDKVPSCPLKDMAVCKQFFDEAAASWFRAHTVRCNNFHRSIEAFINSSAIRAHLTKLSYHAGGRLPDMYLADTLKDLSSLREISILIGEQCFDELKCKLCWVHDFQPCDFKQVAFPAEILDISTLQHMRLEPQAPEMAVTAQEQKKWRQNVAAFEVFLNNELKSRKDTGRVEDQTRITRTPGLEMTSTPLKIFSGLDMAKSTSSDAPAELSMHRQAMGIDTEHNLEKETHDLIRETAQELEDDTVMSRRSLGSDKAMLWKLCIENPIVLGVVVTALICSISNTVVLWLLIWKD